MKIWIGTSGFQYPEWKGTFYPEKMPAAKMLPYYAERLSATEINYTFRRFPSVKTLENWFSLTPEHFVFSLKAPQKVTHFAKLVECEETMVAFFNVARSLGPKLGPVLFQLPPYFSLRHDVLAEFLKGLPEQMQAAFEFRHASWFTDDVYDLLRKYNAALCIADAENASVPYVATADFGYLRLRREDYDAADIQRWAKQVAGTSQWKQACIFFKHEENGVGPKLANQMKAELGL